AAIAGKVAAAVERRRGRKRDPQLLLLADSSPDEGQVGECLALVDQVRELVGALDLGAETETLERFARLGGCGAERRDQHRIRCAETPVRIKRPQESGPATLSPRVIGRPRGCPSFDRLWSAVDAASDRVYRDVADRRVRNRRRIGAGGKLAIVGLGRRQSEHSSAARG